jgi:nucleotide-binding universal stress UspA family protein
MSGIVVGFDGSGHSRLALEWAMREAALRQLPLAVVTVHTAAMGYFGPVSYPGDVDLTQHAREIALKEVDDAKRQLGACAPREVEVLAITGIPAEELLSAAKDADLLVVGSRGAGGFARLLMGSVSSQVAHHAHCPVVIVPPERLS